MRKITREAAEAFVNCRNFNKGNTTVTHIVGSSFMDLHGNRIAERMMGSPLRVTLAGWNTPTTRERLNGLLEVMGHNSDRFYQHQFEPYYRGKRIDANEWITIQ